MKYQVLAQKYRPRNFDEVLGQEAAVRTLKNSISNDRIASAYIFCGPRGVGKTSVARLIAKMINCSELTPNGPCNKCSSCQGINSGTNMDVLEIDGASNRGIDEIRTLRENVKFSPSSGSYKVYIIDEVHMLTSEAFNALLKTLEEPPKHVKFVFATTESHKVLPTIMSRCQRFDFKRIPPKLIFEQLRSVAEKENIDIDEKASLLIARSADGSLRDALVILDQMVSFSDDRITSSDVLDLLGMVHKETIFALAGSVISKNVNETALTIDELINNGKDPVFLANNLISHFRDIMILKTTGAPTSDMAFHDEELLALLEQKDLLSLEEILYMIQTISHSLAMMKNTMYTRVPLEIAMIKLAKRDNILSLDDILSRLERLEHSHISGTPSTTASIEKKRYPEKTTYTVNKDEKKINNDRQSKSHDSSPKTHQSAAADTITNTDEEIPEGPGPGIGLEIWEKTLKTVKDHKLSVYTFLKQAKPLELKKDKVILAFDKEHAFNKDVLESGSNLSVIEESFLNVMGTKPRLEFKITEQPDHEKKDAGAVKKKQMMARKASNPAVETAMDVFGGKIVMDQME